MYKKSAIVDTFEDLFLNIYEKLGRIASDTFFTIDEDKNRVVARLQEELITFLREKNSQVLHQNGRLAFDAFQEAVYIMVSLSDELFLAFDWEGKAYWRAHSLESKIFGTNQAGEKFFQKLDEYLITGDANREIGLLYLYALSLGFRGNLRYEQCNDKLHDLKERLFFIVYQRQECLYSHSDILFSQAQNGLVVEKPQFNKYEIINWKNAMIFCMIFFVFSSSAMWFLQTRVTWKLLDSFKERVE